MPLLYIYNNYYYKVKCMNHHCRPFFFEKSIISAFFLPSGPNFIFYVPFILPLYIITFLLTRQNPWGG